MNPNNPNSALPVMPAYTPPSKNGDEPSSEVEDSKQAAEFIRQKINNLYEEEPSAKEERAEVMHRPADSRSKHQNFMYKLSTSTKPLAEIQTAWHNYYINLPEKEKHEVWQEFYREHGRTSHYERAHRRNPEEDTPNDKPIEHYVHSQHAQPRKTGSRTVEQIKKHITETASRGGKLRPKHHLQSLVFGLGMGSLVLLILLFSFFNERLIAPFITPSRKVSSTPIIIDQSVAAVDPEPKVIIPKINVEIPVNYGATSVDEKSVQKSLETGILHYPTTATPGEQGNSVFFGHSSNNIFNKGKYKFAFVLLRKLEVGDVFYLTKDSKRYAYKVYDRQVVKPEDVGVLGHKDRPATATLITCDPPGTSINRLVVVGEQISPDPGTNVASHISGGQAQPKTLPSNAQSLWQRLKSWLSS